MHLQDRQIVQGFIAPTVAMLLLTRPAAAAPVESDSSANSSIIVIRVDTPPVIDGKLDDEVWKQAPPSGPLTQFDPQQGIPMPQRTEFRFLHDDDHLYLGVWCFDTEPDKIIARKLERDGDIFSDDHIFFVFDTFHDQRNGYVFATNPNGVRRDGTISDNTKFNQDWDGIWQARASIDEEGWKAEIAIPFKTLSFDPTASTWGFNLERLIRRNFARGRWTGARPQFAIGAVSEAGDLTGLQGLQQGLGLEVSPYVVGRAKKGRSGGTGLAGDWGGEIRYRITPNLSTTLSYNTDFAQTEVDRRQINFTRFPLFFPERRDFFLEDSGIFNFGDLGRELIPFFSRRIGLSAAGEIVPITIAGKLAGRVGDYNLGFIDAVIDPPTGLGSQNVFAGRVSRNILEQSSVGLISTIGDPNSDADNFMAGPDFRFRTTRFLGDKALEASFFGLGSYTEDQPTEFGHAYGAAIKYPNDLIWGRLQFLEISGDFNPALGFVRRKEMRSYNGWWSYNPRPASVDWIQQMHFNYGFEYVTDLANELESMRHDVTPLKIEFPSTDTIAFAFLQNFDAPDTDFDIADGVTIPAGDYGWTSFDARMWLARKRIVNGSFGVTMGEFYNGHRQRYGFNLGIRSGKHAGLNLDYAYNIVTLPAGDFETHRAALQMMWNFTPDLLWSHLLQYDSISDTLGYNSRIQWEYKPGQKVFLVLNQSYFADRMSLALQETEATLKAGFTIRF